MSLFYGLQLILLFVIILVLTLPTLLKYVIRLHKKVIQLEYSYFPFLLKGVILRYRYKKHIEAVLNVRQISFTKVPGKWRLRLDMLDVQVGYIVQAPIRIGFIYEEQLYMERLKAKFLPYNEAKIQRRRSKHLSFISLLIESSITNTFFNVLSRLEVSANKMQFYLPKLNSKEEDLPQLVVTLHEDEFVFHINQHAQVECHFRSSQVFFSEKDKDPCVHLEGFSLDATIRPGLTIDLLQEYSTVRTSIEKARWFVRQEEYYTMDVLANEFYPRPDINKILKKHLNESAFLYLNKPRDVYIFIRSYQIHFTVFQESPHFVRYNRNMLFEWEDLSYHGTFDLKDDNQHKTAEIGCTLFKIATQQDDLVIRKVFYTQKSVVSNSIHANDESVYDIKYGDWEINVSTFFVRYLTLIQTEMGYNFRVQFLENFEQKNYFKKYNRIAKQMCCDFLKKELQNTVRSQYFLEVSGKFTINLIDSGQVVDAIVMEGFKLELQEGIDPYLKIQFFECGLFFGSELFGSIFNVQYHQQLQEKRLVISSSDIRVQHANVEKIMRVAMQYRVFRQKLLKKTSFKQRKVQKPLNQDQKSNMTLIMGSNTLAYECKEKSLTLQIGNVSTHKPNTFSINKLRSNFTQSEILNIDNITIELQNHITILLNKGRLQFDEFVENINGFVSQIQQSGRFLQEYKTVLENDSDLTEQFHRRRASHDGVLTQTHSQVEQSKVRSILNRQIKIHLEDMQIMVQDTSLNAFICNYKNFQLHFETVRSRANEHKIIEFLRKPRRFPLLNLQLYGVSVTLNPMLLSLPCLLDKLTKLDSYSTLLEESYFEYMELFQAYLNVQQLKLSVRDYYNDLIDLKDLNFDCFFAVCKLNTLAPQRALRIFHDVTCSVQSFKLAFGLHLAYSFQELAKRIMKILGKSAPQVMNLIPRNEIPFWDRLRLQLHGRVEAKISNSEVKLLTDTSPYSIDCARFCVRGLQVIYSNWNIRAQADRLRLGRIPRVNRILFVPRVQIVADFDWQAKKDQFDHYFIMRRPYFNQQNTCFEDFKSQKLKVSIKADCLQYEYKMDLNMRQQKKCSFFFHYQNQFMVWLKNRSTLRHDYLRLLPMHFGQVFNTPNVEQQHLMLYADYKSLMHYTYFKLMESLMIKQSLYRHTECVDIKIYAHKFRLLFTNSEKPISHSESYMRNKDVPIIGTQSLLQSVKVNIQLEPNCPDGEWRFELKSLSGQCDQLHMAMFDGHRLLDIDAPEALTQQTQFAEFFEINIHKQLSQQEYHLFQTEDSPYQEVPEDETLFRTRSSHILRSNQQANDFDAFDIFLQAKYLRFLQNQTIEVSGPNRVKTKKLVKNFVSAQQAKMLLTFYVQDMWTNIFESLGLTIPVKPDQDKKEAAQAQFTQEQSYTREEVTLLISLPTPQLNFQYHTANRQMILTSPNECQFVFSQYFLPFDTLMIDRKRISQLHFDGLDCYLLDAKDKVQFLNSKLFQQVIKCDTALFSVQTYALKSNEKNFAQLMSGEHHPLYWNQELRRDQVSVQVGQMQATFSKPHMDGFLDMVLFFEMVVTSKNEYENKERFFRNKMKELQQFGGKQIEQQIRKKIWEEGDRYGSEKSKIDYSIEHLQLNLTDESDVAFIQFNTTGIRVAEIIYDNQGRKTDISLQDLDVISRLEEADPLYKMVLSQDIKNQKTTIFKLSKWSYPLQIYQQKWFVIDQMEIQLNPIVIKLTDELYDKFYTYFFGDDLSRKERASSERKEQIKNMTDSIGKQIPDYYNGLSIGELKLNASFRHPSKIKRFKDVVVVIEPYKSPRNFSTNKEQFDEFATFIIKQITSQIFSILGQKLFG